MPSVATTASLGLLLVCSAATLIDGKSRSVEGNAPIAFPAPAEDKLKQSWKKAKEMGYMLLHADAYHYTRKDCYKPKDGDQIKVTYEGRLRKNGKVFDRSAKGKPYTLDVGAFWRFTHHHLHPPSPSPTPHCHPCRACRGAGLPGSRSGGGRGRGA